MSRIIAEILNQREESSGLFMASYLCFYYSEYGCLRRKPRTSPVSAAIAGGNNAVV